MKYWLVKSEPETYSWDALVRDKRTAWDGVRNFEARNHLRAMVRGDRVLFYHSVNEKRVVGVAEVAREAYPDRTAKDGDWSSVDLVPLAALKEPVSLAVIKEDQALADIALVRRSRLSVMPLDAVQYRRILALAKTRL